jgi:hypothetical protein
MYGGSVHFSGMTERATRRHGSDGWFLMYAGLEKLGESLSDGCTDELK